MTLILISQAILVSAPKARVRNNDFNSARQYRDVKKRAQLGDTTIVTISNPEKGYVGNGYICMLEDADDGLHARTLVSERGRNLCYANMSKQIKGILNSESVTVNEKRLKNVVNRIDRLVKAVCADTTKNGNIRTCMDSSYPSKEQAVGFTDIKATKPWLDEMENLIQSEFS